MIEKDHLCDWSRQPVRKPSSESSESEVGFITGCRDVCHKLNNSLSDGSKHPDDLFQSSYVNPRFTPVS